MKGRGSYQEVGGRRNGDPVVEQLPCVIVHGPALFHRLGSSVSGSELLFGRLRNVYTNDRIFHVCLNIVNANE